MGFVVTNALVKMEIQLCVNVVHKNCKLLNWKPKNFTVAVLPHVIVLMKIIINKTHWNVPECNNKFSPRQMISPRKKWPRFNEENMNDSHEDLNVPCMQSMTHSG